ncbi:DUF1156 domain-containing protein [Dictyobacter formicarum]|uniref:DUF1156 domain-containing protein n=1 Tax=Dictyobacter formicarum TaxID=2778368 RepID=A0ABQ3VQP9_9CHLR|nr:DUF1156 domain-containing protein [Dictyobacter formicarum]GHO88026.1 hypothetical protein KSZ_60320 [Dictyobacter formicarum]
MSSSYRKKLIEVALPLDVINFQSAREKSIRHGHPSTLHLWWARRPLATCRAVLFASLIDDPSEHPERFPGEEAQEVERKRLFSLIEEMVNWDNANKEETMHKVRKEILVATGGNPPPVLDPFAGGGSIPLEAQRLGLEAHASDLNPVAVLLNKALIEIPPKFSNRPPINPDVSNGSLLEHSWKGAQGLAEDIRYYGKWMRDEAVRRIGYLYPKVSLPKAYDGKETNVIAWIWARTVTCPNPSCRVQMPLVRSFWLSKKKGKEAWVQPEIDKSTKPFSIHFEIATDKEGPEIEGTVNRLGGTCIACNSPVPFNHIRSAGQAGHLGQQLLAIVADGFKGRAYLAPNDAHIARATGAKPIWHPEANLPHNPRDFKTPNYGIRSFGDLFSQRQLVALTTFSDLVQDVREKILADARLATFLKEDEQKFYADAVVTYLALAVDRLADRNSTICSWDVSRDSTRNTFARQAIPMVWDFAEANPFSDSTGNFLGAIDWIAETVKLLPCSLQGEAKQRDATTSANGIHNPLISTDPPYYDNIGYADLSDFFYIWLRRSLHSIYPNLFRSMLVPKAQELVATPYRFKGNKHDAEEFFERGLEQAFERMHALHNPEYPLTVYYAFKQAEGEADQEELTQTGRNGNKKVIASTGWETMLEGLIRSGFTITGTWPMRTEMANRSIGQGANALASSIVLVCRPRATDAPIASRRQFLTMLRTELPEALRNLQHGGIAPVDLAQASIGPGMAIYSRYSKVLESDGTPLSVRTGLQLINTVLDDVLAHQEGEYDPETRWAIAWFEEYALNAGEYGRAETLSKAKNTTVQTLIDAGILEAKAGKVRLFKPEELAPWNPDTQKSLTTWAAMQHLLHALDSRGEEGAAELLHRFGEQGEYARDLAYRLYTVCERKGWAPQAQIYNALVTAWSEVNLHAQSQPQASAQSLWDTTEW